MNRGVPTLSAGLTGRPFSSRVNPRYATIIGSADGSIIATIMTTRIARKSVRATGSAKVLAGSRRIVVTPAVVHVTYHARTTTAPTSTAIGKVTDRNSCGALRAAPASMIRGFVGGS